jgi:alpha-glucuronidase
MMLLDEVEKRTQIRWSVASQPAGTFVKIGEQKGIAGPEGYSMRAAAGGVTVLGADERGVLFGVGRLLREMHMRMGRITIAGDLNIITSPKYPLRGHQLGYRPKTNSYDGW